MRAHDRVQDLEHRVPRVAARLVLLGLTNELLDAQLIAVLLAAGELHLGAHHDVQILRDEQSGAIRRELALALPLEQRELEGKDRRGGEEGQVAQAEIQQDDTRSCCTSCGRS